VRSHPAIRPICSCFPTSSRSGRSACSRRGSRSARSSARTCRSGYDSPIGLVPDQVVTESLVDRATVADGEAIADPGRDLAKIAVVERHLATGRVGVGFVRGSGLRRGALASTVAHDAHNLVVLGVSDEDMLAAVARATELGGGIVAVDDGRVLAECPLPVAGLLSDATLAEVIAQSRACNEAAVEMGWSGRTPFLTMSFLALSVIPALKITDRGLVDVERFELVPVSAE
jgi:adenine deaminase